MAFKRILGGGLLNALKGTENLAHIPKEKLQSLSDYITKKHNLPEQAMPERNRLSDVILRNSGTTEKELEPQGAGEALAQNVVSAVANPMGAKDLVKSGIKGAGKLLAGQAARTGLQEVGAPEWAQTAGQLGTEFALGRRQAAQEGKVPKSLKEHTTDTYEKFKSTLKSNERGTAKAINPFLKDARSFHLRETDPDILQRADFIVDKIQANIDKNGNIDVRNAYELRKSLGGDYAKAPKKLQSYIKQARDGLKAVLEEHSPLNPEFGKLHNESAELYSYKKANNIVRDFFDSIPLAKFKHAKITGVPIVLDKIESGVRALHNSSTRKYYFKLIDDVFKDNQGAALRSFNQLQRQIDKDEKEEPISGWKKRETRASNPIEGWKPRKS